MAAKEKKKNKKELILNAAIDTIYEEKISGTYLRQIAKNAGIGLGTLTYYYASKDKLFLDVLDFIVGHMLEKEKTVVEDKDVPPMEKLLFLLNEGKVHLLDHREMVVFADFCINATKYTQLRLKIQDLYVKWCAEIQEVVDEGLRSGQFSSEFSRIMPILIPCIIDGAKLRYLIYENTFDVEDFYSSVRKILKYLIEEQK